MFVSLCPRASGLEVGALACTMAPATTENHVTLVTRLQDFLTEVAAKRLKALNVATVLVAARVNVESPLKRYRQ